MYPRKECDPFLQPKVVPNIRILETAAPVITIFPI
jgi:hypothetical protein